MQGRIQSQQERHLEEHSATQPLLSVLRIVLHLAYATQTYMQQNHVILNIAQIQHHPTFIGISYSLYISFIQANTQFVSASTMYAMQSNANSCMPSAPLVRSGSPPRCCKHLPSVIHRCLYTHKQKELKSTEATSESAVALSM